MAGPALSKRAGPPLWLLAELTYRCPLQCPYCSNPLDFHRHHEELNTEEWIDVFCQARAMGAVQLGLSGGEPLVRQDLEALVAEARQLGFYSNLISSGIGMNRERVAALKEAGLDHIQLSFQDSEAQANNALAGSTKAFQTKLEMAQCVKEFDYPMVVNIVLHRHNIDNIERILQLCVDVGADYVELANTQYYGWALHNRDALLPTAEQVANAEAVTASFRRQHAGKMQVYFVVPDYFESRPKACMNGWASIFLTVTPDGLALPCHSARSLPLDFPSVRELPLKDIWWQNGAFNHYRGDAWMKSPCRDCSEKSQDFGGCRCQAYFLTGDAANADPVCDKSAHHHKIRDAVARAAQRSGDVQPLVLRNARSALALAKGSEQ